MRKTVNILKIIFLVILIAILTGVLVLFTNKDFDFNFGATASLIYDKNIEKDFNKIDIYSESLDIKLVKSNDNNVNVKVYDNKDNNVSVNVEDNTLKIFSENKIKCFFCFMKKREVVVSLPDEVYDLIIESKSGDITSNIDFNNVTIKSTSGDIKFNNINESKITATSGNILIDKVNNITIKSTSGDVDINAINKYLNIETKSGDINIKNLSLTENSKISVTSGDVTIFKSSEDIYYNATATSGDVKIKNNNRFANIELTINAKSGDIVVKN